MGRMCAYQRILKERSQTVGTCAHIHTHTIKRVRMSGIDGEIIVLWYRPVSPNMILLSSRTPTTCITTQYGFQQGEAPRSPESIDIL